MLYRLSYSGLTQKVEELSIVQFPAKQSYFKNQDSGIYQCFISNEIGQNVTGISLDVRSSFSDDDDEEEAFPVTPFVDPATLTPPSKPNTTQLSPDSVMIR